MITINCPIQKDTEEGIIAQRAYDDLNNAFKYSRGSIYNTPISTAPTNNTLGVNYLYLSTIRGGSYKKSMENKENFCNTCMKGGCFTCPKGKTKISVHYNIIVISLPKLYKKYKKSKLSKQPTKQPSKKFVKNPKKGGDSANDNAIDMYKITRTDYLPLEKYKEFQPFNVDSQLFL